MKAHESHFTVRFNEVDSYGVVWHGRYIDYFEIGRLDLCKRFDLSPDDMRALGLFAPVVEIKCRLRAPARYADRLIVSTSILPTDKAMLTFVFRIVREADTVVVAEGETSHVLLTLEGTMLYDVPEELRKRIDRISAYLHDA